MDLPLERDVTLLVTRSRGKAVAKIAQDVLRKRGDIHLMMLNSRVVSVVNKKLSSYRYDGGHPGPPSTAICMLTGASLLAVAAGSASVRLATGHILEVTRHHRALLLFIRFSTYATQ